MNKTKNLISKPIKIIPVLLLPLLACLALLQPINAVSANRPSQGIGPQVGEPTPDLSNAKVHGYFFYSNACSHCIDILNEIVIPLQEQNPGLIDLRLLELGTTNCYTALINIEDQYKVDPADRALPTVIIGDQILIGEEQNKANLKAILEAGLAGEGIPFPEIPCINPEDMISIPVNANIPEGEVCTIENPSACTISAPIHAAYFYQVGCKECSRADADLNYLQSQYPQLVIEELNIYEETALANWMAERAGRTEDIQTPALFIGNQAWIGEAEITPQNLTPAIEALVESGSEAFWQDFDPESGNSALMEKFKSIGAVAILLAGLVDGLNPCAFATIVFFISYLTLSGKKGKEVLITGTMFTLGVFLAYLVVGLGFYKVLDLVRNTLNVVSKVVYGLTALLCLTLAFFSIKDYFKARQGKIEDMSLNLPEPLRKRINATIREGRKSSSYFVGAFVTGVLISFLELACTGQIYLPTIIYMSSVPELRGRAISFLLIYNLMFIIPLIVIFILAYLGTTSKDLTLFLKKHAAPVKLGMAVVFISLSIWLTVSLFA